MAIEDLMLKTAANDYYDPEFHAVIEAHVSYLYNHPETVISTISPMDLYVYEFDFYGLLTSMGVPPEQHFATLRMNKLNSPQDDFSKMEFIRIPDKGVLSKILQRWKTKKRA